jgi:predicted DNA repair protein MutK
LAAVPAGSVVTQALVLAVVATGITVAVYGVVALIVKADDAGVALARNEQRSVGGRISRALGRALVLGMPTFLKFLSAAGTAAMIWVGGGIVLHGLEIYGPPQIHHVIEGAARAVVDMAPVVGPVLEWTTVAAISGVIGLAIGGALLPVVEFVIAPAWKRVKGLAH